MTRHASAFSRRIVRWIPRSFLLGTVVVGGTLSLSETALAKGGLSSLFGKAQPATDTQPADSVLEIRKLLAEARFAAAQRDYSTAIRQAERAQKLAEGSAATIRSAPDCSPGQIATVLQQYRQARAGKDVRLSLNPASHAAQPVKPASKTNLPTARPPAASARPAVETKSGKMGAPVEKLLGERSRPVTAANSTPPAIAQAVPRATPKNITEFRPTPIASQTRPSTIEIRKRPDEPLASRSSFFDESLIRTSAARQSTPPQPPDLHKAAGVPDQPTTEVAAEVKAMDSGSLMASQAAASTTSGIDPALTERLLKPLSGMRVRIQEPTFAPSAPAEDEVAAPADDIIALDAESVDTEGTGEELAAAEPEIRAPLVAAEVEVESPPPTEATNEVESIETLAPIYEVQTAEAVAEAEPTFEQVSDQRPARDAQSTETFGSSSGVRYLEWSPVVEPPSQPVISAEVTVEEPRQIDVEAGAPFDEMAFESEETAGVEQAGFRGRGEWSSTGRGEAAPRRPVEDEATGPFVVFREPATGAATAWEVAPPPPAEIAVAATGGTSRQPGLTRETVWWFSAAGILLAILGLSTWLPRRQ